MGLFSKYSKSELSPEDEETKKKYLSQFNNKASNDIPIRKVSFVVLDTETSGLNVKKDILLSIAAFKVQDFSIKIDSCFEELIFQEEYKPGESIKIHGILGKEVKRGADEKEVLTRFLDYLGNDVIVGHHISFDIKMLNKALKKHLDLKLKNRTLDTAILASRIENPLISDHKPFSLDDLCHKYDVQMGERHTAAGDAYITSIIFLKMLGILERKGVKMIIDL